MDADTDMDDTNDNDTRQTKHDCIGSLPNEPKTVLVFRKNKYIRIILEFYISNNGY